jgi:hypothetical protein
MASSFETSSTVTPQTRPFPIPFPVAPSPPSRPMAAEPLCPQASIADEASVSPRRIESAERTTSSVPERGATALAPSPIGVAYGSPRCHRRAMRRPIVVAALAPVTLLAMLAAASCGSRTGLEPEPEPARSEDDGGIDVAPPDAPSDAVQDTHPPREAAPEAAIDAPPPIDATPPKDAPTCPTGLTAYLISASAELYSFDPPTLATRDLGALRCPTGTVPWTLTASSAGTIYVLYEDWKLYAVDPATLSCETTPYIPGQLSLGPSDGVTVAPDDGGERLYVYGQTISGQTLLAEGDLTSFVLSEVGLVAPAPTAFPLDFRADAFGRLFGLSQGGAFVQIDRTTAALLAEDTTSFNSGSGWALLTYDSAIYFFAGGNVSQYDLAKKTVTPIGSIGVDVVVASAAPCLH